MMDPKFAGKLTPAPYIVGRAGLDQMPDTPTRRSRHRRAQSETFFRFPPEFDDDILLDDVVADFNPTAAMQPANSGDSSSAGPDTHFRSLSVDSDFFDGLDFGASSAAYGGGAAIAPSSDSEKMVVGPGPRHRHSNSMDGSFSTSAFEADSALEKKGMNTDRLAELALIDPKRAKRILANRQSAARSKERKTRYTNELERKVQTLQTEATALSAQMTLLQRDTCGLTAENKELKIRLQALEEAAHLRDALSDTLREELQRLKIAAGETQVANGSGATRVPGLQSFAHFGNLGGAQQQVHIREQAQPGFLKFNRRG
ncbi:unnamed protein product [Cuscuta campestris]|uniref:BZIP domain-containing protein n=1 Tax=Cuscuta campestris TaxID=132261 RepID=A0A484M919_9ASTE|nr:unnamed protein product [Cuscuta campestris]